MSKRIVLIWIVSMLLSACGASDTWEDEEVHEVSHRIMADDVRADWSVAELQTPSSDKMKIIRLTIGRQDGSAIDEFDVTHDKMLHLIVVSDDLSYFDHIHPEYLGGGVFEIEHEFPQGGEYQLIADFKPVDGDATTKSQRVRIAGRQTQSVPIVPDGSLEQNADGIRVNLAIDQLTPRQDATLKFSMTDVKSGKPITDLQPYLGAIGHVVILSDDGERYLHVHAEEDQGTGPDAVFETQFPRSGVYKIWGQFQHNDQVITVPYVVKV
ncbi:hypothetical protein [Cohnella terricola]|uniref:YtkA-like domain-containing protein n=1 Tax=Cohnella terricola TaxID=1289167 RepID=A0A559JTU6_9BACL|nr:hypothetical protein [Cohnella terricola]TVY03308.1 hypothetical protein FPZ45_05390 [Cohnella terricola]